MKRLLIAAALLGSAGAYAQPPQEPPPAQPEPAAQPPQPDPTATPPADPMPPEPGPDAAPPISPGPQPMGPMTPTPQSAAPQQQRYSYGSIPPSRPADETYERCSRTVADNCVQGGPR